MFPGRRGVGEPHFFWALHSPCPLPFCLDPPGHGSSIEEPPPSHRTPQGLRQVLKGLATLSCLPWPRSWTESLLQLVFWGGGGRVNPTHHRGESKPAWRSVQDVLRATPAGALSLRHPPGRHLCSSPRFSRALCGASCWHVSSSGEPGPCPGGALDTDGLAPPWLPPGSASSATSWNPQNLCGPGSSPSSCLWGN